MKKIIACIFICFLSFAAFADNFTGLFDIPLMCKDTSAFSKLKEQEFYLTQFNEVSTGYTFGFSAKNPKSIFGEKFTSLTMGIEDHYVISVAVGLLLKDISDSKKMLSEIAFKYPDLVFDEDNSSPNLFRFQDKYTEFYLEIRLEEKQGRTFMIIFASIV